MEDAASNVKLLSRYTFPRTGKRGVPQQFPRRLFEMLEAEAAQLKISAKHPKIISWSESGQAFRIFDVSEFSSSILPKYFRTKKFSSFQRNLNLYGFAKVRRGPEMDMYAHPSFVRDNPESMLSLRKITSAHRQGLEKSPLASSTARSPAEVGQWRPVSPSSPSTLSESPASSPASCRSLVFTAIPEAATSLWSPICAHSTATVMVPLSPTPAPRRLTSNGSNDRGKLDLLALAVETSAISSV